MQVYEVQIEVDGGEYTSKAKLVAECAERLSKNILLVDNTALFIFEDDAELSLKVLSEKTTAPVNPLKHKSAG